MSKAPPDPLDGDWLRSARLAELGLHAATVLHELRQPLFALRALGQIGTAKGGLPADRIVQLVMEVEHMAGLVDAWASLTHAGGPDEVLDVNEPVRNAALMLSHRATPVAEFRVVCEPRALLIRGRTASVQQVAVNLLANAWDAVALQAAPMVAVYTRDSGDFVEIVVEDNGEGVPEALRERVFEPFVTTKAPGEGTGLGLYLARRTVEESGGSLALEAEAGRGARFVARWPRAQAYSGAGPSSAPSSSESSSASG